MTLDLNDPRLTAYALGELDDAEHREIEILIQGSDDLRHAVEQIRATAQTLSTQLLTEPAPALTAEQRTRIESLAASESDGVPHPVSRYSGVGVGDGRHRVYTISRSLSMAAMLMVAAGLGFVVYGTWPNVSPSRTQLAMRDGLGVPKGGNEFAYRKLSRDEIGVIEKQANEKKEREVESVDERRSPVPRAKDANSPTDGVGASQAEMPSESLGQIGSTADEVKHVNEMIVLALGDSDKPDQAVIHGKALRALGYAADDALPNEASYGHQVPSSEAAATPPQEGAAVQAQLMQQAVIVDNKDAPAKSPARNAGTGGKGKGSNGRGRQGDEETTPPSTVDLGQVGKTISGARLSERPMLKALGYADDSDTTGDRRDLVARYTDAETLLEELRNLGYVGDDEDDSEKEYVVRGGLGRKWSVYFGPTPGAESYDPIIENEFLAVGDRPLSTFSLDVDTASYSNVRRFLTQGQLPPKDAVRIEELVNYFDYEYPTPEGDDPFGAEIEVAGCPWAQEHRLVRVGIRGKDVFHDERPTANLVFLIDVSGSMQPENKLPLVKSGLHMLVPELRADDRVAIVTYAGEAGLKLESTPVAQSRTILSAIDGLSSGGSTNGGGGIRMAYDTAFENFIEGGINRIIWATDGDFNVGTTNRDDLVELVTDKAKGGVFLTMLGFGMGNLKDSMLEQLADKGNGHYAYIDTHSEARKVLVEQLEGTMVTIAKDVKVQVEFNPAQVAAYRLIGYENRMLRAQDFNDDRKDAGEIGAGHTVTALYEVVPAGIEPSNSLGGPSVDPLKYQPTEVVQDDPQAEVEADIDPPTEFSHELLTVKIRYKDPEGEVSKLLEFPVVDEGLGYTETTDDFRFAAAVASFGMILRDSRFKGAATYDNVLELAGDALSEDASGYRTEFMDLVEMARSIRNR